MSNEINHLHQKKGNLNLVAFLRNLGGKLHQKNLIFYNNIFLFTRRRWIELTFYVRGFESRAVAVMIRFLLAVYNESRLERDDGSLLKSDLLGSQGAHSFFNSL